MVDDWISSGWDSGGGNPRSSLIDALAWALIAEMLPEPKSALPPVPQRQGEFGEVASLADRPAPARDEESATAAESSPVTAAVAPVSRSVRARNRSASNADSHPLPGVV